LDALNAGSGSVGTDAGSTSMNVIEQQIDVTLPATSVRMLIVQPFLELQNPIQEPFNLHPDCVTRLMAAIDSVFTIARTFHPHFIVFPEFSLPGIAAVSA
jgi:hypothetical protein